MRAPLSLAMVVCIAGCTASETEPDAPTADASIASAEPASPPTPAEALLARSIAYHDPAAEWDSYHGALAMDEVRPDGSSREASVELDVATGGFAYIVDAAEGTVVKRISPEGCSATVDGAAPDSAASARHRLECPQIERSRNYYLYLWGLPMKLRDPGTFIDSDVVRTTFEGGEVDQIRVTYDPQVGGDTWYFYFDPADARMVGYRFYHDESANDGEYITLTDEFTVGQMRLPARRRWFVNADDRFLGEDILVGAGPPA